MGRGGVDDPEKDASLFPESRVRPWVIDEDAESQVRNLRDDLERTLTCVSPVKDGVGASSLDRILSDDDRGRVFFEKLALLQTERKTKEAQKDSGACALRPIGEVFEDLYRETHGLPPRRNRSSEVVNDGLQDSGEKVVVEKFQEEDPLCSTQEGNGGLATDPDIAHLIAMLHEEGDPEVDGDDGVKSEDGSDSGSQKNECISDGDIGIEEGCENGTSQDGYRKGDSSAITGVREGQGMAEAHGEVHEEETDATLTRYVEDQDRKGRRRNQNGKPHAGRKGRVNRPEHVVMRVQEDAASCLSSARNDQHQQQSPGRVDISRMKIDRAERGAVVGPRPRSAPSACLSAGGFSQMSRATSSHLARAVSQRLLQAEKDLTEQDSADAKEIGRANPFLTVADSGVRIDIVKQNANALQARNSIKRMSYLKGSRPRPARWFPRDTNAWYGRPHAPGEISSHAHVPMTVAEAMRKQRPLTAGSQRKETLPLAVLGGSRSTPLLTQTERHFIFGQGKLRGASWTAPTAAEAAVTDAIYLADEADAVSFRPPSARQTTLGRMLRRAASVASSETSATSTTPRRGTVLDSAKESYSGRRSSSSLLSSELVGGRTADSGSYNNGGGYNAQNDTSGGRTVRIRPRSAGPSVRRSQPFKGRTETARSRRAEGSPHTNTADGGKPKSGCRHKAEPESNCALRGGNFKQNKKGITLAAMSAVRGFDAELLAPESDLQRECGGAGVPLGSTYLKVQRTAGANPAGREMNVHQALEAALKAAAGSVTPRGQFVTARKLIAEMKNINTKDSTGEILLSTQVRTRLHRGLQ